MLGLSRAAGRAEIKAAYYAMAKAHHPDSNNGAVSSSSAEQFHRVQAAYELLSDPTRKADFDRYGRADDSSGSGGWARRGRS